LKQELSMIETERRHWLEIAQSHMNCSDQRIALYLQQRADILSKVQPRPRPPPGPPPQN
jgi:hypothetical protein